VETTARKFQLANNLFAKLVPLAIFIYFEHWEKRHIVRDMPKK
jgi:hypothetical protein